MVDLFKHSLQVSEFSHSVESGSLDAVNVVVIHVTVKIICWVVNFTCYIFKVWVMSVLDNLFTCIASVSDKKCWDTLAKRCFFPSRAPLVPLKAVYRGLFTESCTPTLRGQGDPKVSQPF